jgi:hypothetical protein
MSDDTPPPPPPPPKLPPTEPDTFTKGGRPPDVESRSHDD